MSEPVEKQQRSFRDRGFLAAATLLFLLLFAGGGFYAWKLRASAAAAAKAAQQAKAEPLGDLSAGAEVSFSGQLQARNIVPVGAPIDGTLESLDVEPGAEVSEEQLLGRVKNEGLAAAQQAAQQDVESTRDRVNNLESALIAARLEASRAAADLDRARGEASRLDRQYKREEMLYREGASPRLRFEKLQKENALAQSEEERTRTLATQAEDRVKNTIAELDAAKRILEEKQKSLEGATADMSAAEIRSPVDGVLIAAKAKVGDEVEMTTTDLFQIAVAPEELIVPVEPDARALARFKEGLPALVQVLELGGDGIVGELKKSEAGQWRVEFKAGDPAIKPGLNAIVKIKLQ